MSRLVLAILLFALAACATPKIAESSGIEAPAPFGFDLHCAIDPGPECPKAAP